MSKATYLEVICLMFVALFCYATASKILEYDLFKAQIGKSPLIMHYVKWIAFLVPASEILLSIGLLIPQTRLVALFGSFTLMAMFTLYIAFILIFSPYVPCSCGGILNNLGWTEHLVFNVGFTVLAVVGIYLHSKMTDARSIITAPAI